MVEFHRENRIPKHIKDVGIIYDTMVHDIDTANFMFGEFPETVFARAGKFYHNHEDFATIVLSYRDSHVAVLTSNWITPNKVRRFNAVCTEANVSGDFITQEIKISNEFKTEMPRLEIVEPLLNEIKSFIGAVNKENELVVKPEQALEVTRIAEACIKSSISGKPVYL